MENTLLTLGSAVLKKAALNQQAKNYILANQDLFNLFKKAADRYIGGETLEETIQKVIAENNRGFKCSIEFMGENTATEEEAIEAKNEFLNICANIQRLNLHSTVSLDLSHIGLGISKELCLGNLSQICDKAALHQTEVIISAEGPEATDAVLSLYQQAAKTHRNLSITLQAYLHRTREDFTEMLKLPGRIRMVKGAFDAPSTLALPRGEELDAVYLDYVDQLLSNHHACAIATHHAEIQLKAKALVLKHQAKSDDYEFESLYGIHNEQLAELKAQGFTTKIYFVYGKEWYLYLCNRIAEYPLNIFRALNDIIM